MLKNSLKLEWFKNKKLEEFLLNDFFVIDLFHDRPGAL